MLKNVLTNNVVYCNPSLSKNSGADIKAGSVILIEKPFVYLLKSSIRNERCAFCFKTGKVSRCSGCQYFNYCGRDCQKMAWAEHKLECQSLKKIRGKTVPDIGHLMAKVILKQKRGGEHEAGFFSDTQYWKFKDLMSHYSDMKKDVVKMEHFASICGVLQEFIGASEMPNTAELLGIFGRISINAYAIVDYEMYEIGTGVYLGGSRFDHSCAPNAVPVFEGTTLHIRAIKDIVSPDFQKIFISYRDTCTYTVGRQLELKDHYYFMCKCQRCLDDNILQLTDSMVCSSEECGSPVAPAYIKTSVKACHKCGTVIPQERLEKFYAVSTSTEEKLNEMKEMTYLNICMNLLKEQEGLFHQHNLLYVKTLEMAFESAVGASLFTQAWDFGQKLIPSYRIYIGEHHPLYGILLMRLGKISVYLGNYKVAVKELKCAVEVLKITHGTDHTLFTAELNPLLAMCSIDLQN